MSRMYVRVNCKYNDNGLYCKNKKVKRSLFGIGERQCKLTRYSNYQFSGCEFQESYPRPSSPPPAPTKRKEYDAKILVIQK